MDMHPQLRLHEYASSATAARIGILQLRMHGYASPATATTTSPEQRVQKQSFSDAKGAEGGGTRLLPRANHPTRTEVEISPDVVRGGADVYSSVCGLFAKVDIARRLGPHT